jgi:hypothetical protein
MKRFVTFFLRARIYLVDSQRFSGENGRFVARSFGFLVLGLLLRSMMYTNNNNNPGGLRGHTSKKVGTRTQFCRLHRLPAARYMV